MSEMPSPDLLARFSAIVGKKHALTPDKADLTRYTEENRHIFPGRTPLVLKPGDTSEVAAILKLANETGTTIVPQGGHTGHAAGAAPDASGSEIVLSMERMKAIRETDLAGNTLTVEAGCVLETVQDHAAANDRLFPLSLGAQGSCQIGGNIATNAGGTGVLAFGNTRDLVLGLEVVLASGEVWHGLRKLKKDNTGYNLKHLFIGSEGTLGVITAAVLKLFPRPRGRAIALAGLSSPQAALALLNGALAVAGKSLTGFELMPRIGIDFVLRHGGGYSDPLADPHPWYVLLEISSATDQSAADQLAETILGEAVESGTVTDAVIGQSEARRAVLWSIREALPPAQQPEGVSIKHDISLPVHLVPAFMEKADRLVLSMVPEARVVAFGHLGDGNIHYNISQPVGADRASFLAERERINAKVHLLVTEMGGSISAEHGIGRLKRDLLAETKQPLELEMMRGIKRLLDPNGILNPGKVV